ncbi:MAG: hypothetical protein EOO07_21430 [Chitinophagaceae bacterium]|nr:MAG: hypothetical protein EOO07_21430 [Chitinophagaceae bacterium]
MKTVVIIIKTILLPVLTTAQSYTVDTAKNLIEVHGDFNGAAIHLAVVKKLPAYEGGKAGWQHFLRSNIDTRVPFTNKALPGVYNVIIKFIVGHDGKLHSLHAVSNHGKGMETEVLRCINKSKPWQPAESESGRKVSYTLNTMVTFKITTNNAVIEFD